METEMTKEQESELRRTAKENLDKIKALSEDDPGYQAAKELGLISWYENLLHDLGPEDDQAGESILGELTPDNTENLYTEDKHFGEEQAEGLDSLLEGLKDTPHDNRW